MSGNANAIWKTVLKHAALPAASVLLVACDDYESPVWPEYVQSTGIDADARPIHWVDDEHLIFNKSHPESIEEDRDDPNQSGGRRTIMNHITGEMDIGPYEIISPMCVKITKDDAGKIVEQRIRYLPAGPYKEVAGVPGQEKPSHPPVREGDGANTPIFINYYRCDYLEEHETIPDRNIKALREGDGYISSKVGLLSEGQDYRYHKTLDDPGTPTPFHKYSGSGFYGIYTSRYIDFTADTPHDDDLRKVYFFADSGYGEKGFDGPEDCLPAYWFRPRGTRFRSVCLPWNNSWQYIMPTRLGYVLNQRTFNTQDIYTSGIYLVFYGDTPFETGRMVKLAATLTFGQVDVSPDGCKIAWRHHPTFNWNKSEELAAQVEIKIIDLCRHAEAIRALPDAPPLDVYPVK